MRHDVFNTRLATTGSVCTLLVLAGGIAALVATRGVVIASGLLTLNIIVAAIGLAAASNRRAGFGIALLLAAALPLFLIFYEFGRRIMLRMGSGVAGGILLGIGAAMLIATIWVWLAAAHAAGPARRAH
jgi:hypothetical protein